MESTIFHAPLNPVQLFVLRTFATAKSEQDRDELTSLYLDYLQKKLEEILNTHYRTPYK